MCKCKIHTRFQRLSIKKGHDIYIILLFLIGRKLKKKKTPKTKKLNAAHQILSVETIFCNLSHNHNLAIPHHYNISSYP